MNPFKLMMILIFIVIIALLIAVAVFVFQLNLQSTHPGEFSLPLVWEFIVAHPMYSFGLLAPTIGMIIGLVKLSKTKFEKFSFS